jgi:hypothetical protein
MKTDFVCPAQTWPAQLLPCPGQPGLVPRGVPRLPPKHDEQHGPARNLVGGPVPASSSLSPSLCIQWASGWLSPLTVTCFSDQPGTKKSPTDHPWAISQARGSVLHGPAARRAVPDPVPDTGRTARMYAIPSWSFHNGSGKPY